MTATPLQNGLFIRHSSHFIHGWDPRTWPIKAVEPLVSIFMLDGISKKYVYATYVALYTDQTYISSRLNPHDVLEYIPSGLYKLSGWKLFCESRNSIAVDNNVMSTYSSHDSTFVNVCQIRARVSATWFLDYINLTWHSVNCVHIAIIIQNKNRLNHQKVEVKYLDHLDLPWTFKSRIYTQSDE